MPQSSVNDEADRIGNDYSNAMDQIQFLAIENERLRKDAQTERDRLASLIEGMKDRMNNPGQSLTHQGWRAACILAARTVQRGRHLTDEEQIAHLLAGLNEAPVSSQ